MKLGNISVDLVSDGTYLMDGGAVFGQIPKAEWEQYAKPDRRNRVRLSMNCLVIRTPTANILIDAGAGSKRADKLKDKFLLKGNKLLKNLKTLGLTARDIDIVVLTHLRFDHAGGCTKLDRMGMAVPAFPKAEYMVQRECWEAANNPNERELDSLYEDDFMPLEEKGLITLLDGETEIAPGVVVRVAGGHMRGNQMVFIESGAERIAYAGDVIPTPHHLDLTHIAATDHDPNATLMRKRDLIKKAIDYGWLLVFGHGLECHAGYLEQHNGRAKLLPVAL